MVRMVSAALCVGFLAVPAAMAEAQTCAGAASFSTGPARVGAGLEFADDAKQYAANLTFGMPAGPFAGLSIGRVDVDNTDESATSYAGEIGYSLNIAGRGSLEVCPVLGFGYASADVEENGVSADISSHAFSVGFVVGGVASASPTLSVIPSIGFAYQNQTLEIESDFLNVDESEDFGVITLAAGFVFNQRVTVRPSFAIPVGLDESDPTYGVGIGFNFGTPRP